MTPWVLTTRHARPRQRKAQPAPDDQSTDPDTDDCGEDDQPAWAHHSQVDSRQLTPMLRHYVELKAAHPERVLLYRLGDFFECFFEDAITLSRCWSSPSPARKGQAVGRVPMAGIPHHAAERYCGELIRRGFSVALCTSSKRPRQGPAQARHHPGAHPGHGAGGGHAQRPPQQLAGGGGGRTRQRSATVPLGSGQRRCEHR